jgi:phage gp46-like protein
MALPDVGAIIAEANQPAGLDVALRQSPTSFGRLTFDWSAPGGDLRFDDSAAYPVFGTVLGRKGLYRWDRTLGSLLFTVIKDKRSTGSKLTAYARDGGAQVEADEIAQDVTPRAEKLATGRWRLNLRWVAAGQARQQAVKF